MRIFWATTALSLLSGYAVAEAPPRFKPGKNFESFAHISFPNDNQTLADDESSFDDDEDFTTIADLGNKSLVNKKVKVHPKHVTNEEYQKFIQATGHPAPPHWVNGKYPEGKADASVVNVSYQDALDYAKWANKNLPSQTEWMSAADQLSWDLEMPKNEWTTSPSPSSLNGMNQILLNRQGEMTEMNPLERSLDTGFRVASPIDTSLERNTNAFETPRGTLRPDQSIEQPGGNILNPNTNPYDYGQ